MRNSILALIASASTAFAQTEPVTLTSPNGQLAISFQTVVSNQPAASGQLIYSVTFHGQPLFEPSKLGLDLKGQPSLGANVRIVNAANSSADETYPLLAGKTSLVRDHYNAVSIALEEPRSPHRQLIVEARAYDDAIAFRYVVPEQKGLRKFLLTREDTQFRLSADATAWALELPNFRSMYESEFIKLPVSAFANQGGVASRILIGCPLLLQFPGLAWVAITEADLRGNSSMYLMNPSESWVNHFLEVRISPDTNNSPILVRGTLPHQSAWRVLLVGDEPGRLIESTVITSLNPPCAIPDTSWIHPGKAAWNWWGGSRGADGQSAYNTDVMKYYVDFAAQSGFPYMLVDAGWSARNDITRMNGSVDIPGLVSYAAAKNVKIWIWLHYNAASQQMEQAFPMYEKWGVAGVKIDFVERDDQGGMDWYYHAAELAAKHHLMLDFHGCTKPSGIERTWPNIMGYEAVAGMEQSKAGARDNPPHHVTLPFTRMLAGPMDYTPGAFDNVTRDEFVPRMNRPMVMGTRAQQLAMYVVYQAPIQMVSDAPQNYAGQPAFQFIKDVPASWDETRVLAGLPGEFISVARRSGSEWFLGSMTDWTPRQLDIPLSFLGDGRYRAEIYADAPDADRQPKDVALDSQTVDRNTTLKASLAPGGGYAVRFVPAP